MDKQVLIEYLPFQPLKQQLMEARVNPRAPFLVSGKVQAANKPNANNRIYDEGILRKQVNLYMEGPVMEKRALGELDHPETSIINLKNVCHNITKLWWDATDLYGEFQILDTPSGNILKQLFLAGLNVGVSSRAMGSVRPIGEGLVTVEDDLELICWDFVSTPSTYGAYVKPVGGLNEAYTPALAENANQKISRLISEIVCTQSGVCCIK